MESPLDKERQGWGTRQQDTVAGLYDFLYRRYSPVQGRWISPDPAGMSAVNTADPQTWNRYAYAKNNPLMFTDPLGLYPNGIRPEEIVGTLEFNDFTNDIMDSSFTWQVVSPVFVVGGLNLSNRIFSGDNEFRWPAPPLIQTILSDLLGLPMNLSCPQIGGVSDLLCGGISPIISGVAANNFTLGIRAPGQTWSQCMAANANTYSIGGATELTVNVATGTNSNISEKTSIVTGNGITDLFFEGPGADDLLTAASHGAGSPLTVGRRTSDVMSLNLAGKGGLPQALGSTGAKGFFETAGKWLNLGLDEAEKFAVDAGLAGAESINCAIPRVP